MHSETLRTFQLYIRSSSHLSQFPTVYCACRALSIPPIMSTASTTQLQPDGKLGKRPEEYEDCTPCRVLGRLIIREAHKRLKNIALTKTRCFDLRWPWNLQYDLATRAFHYFQQQRHATNCFPICSAPTWWHGSRLHRCWALSSCDVMKVLFEQDQAPRTS